MEHASNDQEDLGLGLRPGDPQYRAYVGPPEDYDLIAAMVFNLLTTLGLRQHHSVLDIGCGSLRIGRLLIPYLNRVGSDAPKAAIVTASKVSAVRFFICLILLFI